MTTTLDTLQDSVNALTSATTTLVNEVQTKKSVLTEAAASAQEAANRIDLGALDTAVSTSTAAATQAQTAADIAMASATAAASSSIAATTSVAAIASYQNGSFAEFYEQGKRGLKSIFPSAQAVYDLTDYLSDAGAQTAFTDTAGTLPLTSPATSLARMDDLSGKARNALQSNAAQRPLFGRAPREVRNLLTRTEEFDNAVWAKGFGSITATDIVDPLGESTAEEFTSSGASGILSNATSVVVQTNTVYTASVWMKLPAGSDTILLSITTGGFGILQSVNCSVTDSWQRFTVSGNVGANTAVKILIGGSNTIGVGDVVHVWGAQLEVGTTATPYQRVGAATDVTERGVPSYGFARFDLSDDNLVTTLPDGHTGDLMIFGRNGTWKEANTVASAGTFQLGGSATGQGTLATPGILRATGDVLGYALTGKTLTDEETKRLTQYYASMGAKGLLELGPELVTNGGFDDLSAWTLGTGWSIGGGLATKVAGVAAVISQLDPFVADTAYQIEFAVSGYTAGTLTPQLIGGTTQNGLAVSANGTFRQVLRAVSGNNALAFNANAAFAGSIDNVSVRALTPSEVF